MRRSRNRTRLSAALVALMIASSLPGTPAANADVGTESTERRLGATRERARETADAVRRRVVTAEVPVSSLADDAFPGGSLESESELPYPLIIESLSTSTDEWDIYEVLAFPGEQISFYVDSDPWGEGSGLDVSVYLWDSAATSSVSTPISLVDRGGAGEAEWICYTVPRGKPSTFRVGVRAIAGAGDADYYWDITSRSDGNIPGVPLPVYMGVSDIHEVMSDGDQDDVYSINLAAGMTLDVATVLDEGVPSVRIFAPGTTDIAVATPVASGTAGASYTVPDGHGGTYYVDIWADGQDYCSYGLGWSTVGNNIPGDTLLKGTWLWGVRNVGYVDLRAGEYFGWALPSSGAALFGPGAYDVNIATPIVADRSSNPWKQLSYVVPEGGDGKYFVTGGTEWLYGGPGWETLPAPIRLSGPSRYASSARVSRFNFARAHTVVIASGTGFADALSGAGLAGAYDAPVLLVAPGRLPDEIRAEIVRLGAARCLIVGGTAAVGDGVKAAIDAIPGMATPVRIAGANRYETSARVADAVFTKCGWNQWVGEACVARGDAYADALALAPYAWVAKAPILLTQPSQIPAPVYQRLDMDSPLALPFWSVVVAGGVSAVSDGVFATLANTLDLHAERAAGANRYSTALEVAKYAVGSGLCSWDSVGLATGANYPDALSGGAGIGKAGGVLLMTEPTRFTAVARDQMRKPLDTKQVQVVGGPAAVSDAVLGQVRALYPYADLIP